MPDPAVPMNDPAARTETGEIKDQTSTQVTTPEVKVEATPPVDPAKVVDPAKPAEPAKPDGKSLLNQEEEKKPAEAAPDKYADFKAPEGFILDPATLDKAAPLFKEMNLSQDQAQKLVDFYAENVKASAEKPYNDYLNTRKEWQDQVKKDFGNQLPEVKATIGRAIDLLPQETVKAFREAMDLTGAGDNPAFVKAFYDLAKRATEGRPVAGRGPSSEGQTDPSKAGTRPSAAQALFPTLPSSAAS